MMSGVMRIAMRCASWHAAETGGRPRACQGRRLTGHRF